MRRIAAFTLCLSLGLGTAAAGPPPSPAPPTGTPGSGPAAPGAPAAAPGTANPSPGSGPAGTAAGAAPGAAPGAAGSARPVGAPPASWEGAEPLALARGSGLCKAVRIGEWARITCSPEGFIMDVQLLGGSHEGVSFREARAEKGVHIVFPMREGDRREVYIAVLSGGDGYSVEEDVAVVLSELWLPGAPGPEIAIAGNPR